jgi:hypothetical protein
MATLFEAKQRTHVERAARMERSEPIEPPPTDRAAATPPVVPLPDRSTKPQDSIGTTSSLLEKKRARRK